jgi:hypothetical protein
MLKKGDCQLNRTVTMNWFQQRLQLFYIRIGGMNIDPMWM